MDEKKTVTKDIDQLKADAANKAIEARNGIKSFFTDNINKILVGVGVAGAAAAGFIVGKYVVYDEILHSPDDLDIVETVVDDDDDDDDDSDEDETDDDD